MSITVNKKTISELLYQINGKDEMIALLNEIIDEELEKEEMNTELVDECVQAIMDLESAGSVNALCSYRELVRYCHSTAFKNRIRLRRALAVAAAAAIITGGTFAASPALAQQAKNFLNSIMQSLGIAADETDIKNSDIVSIYAVPQENAVFTVKNESEIKTDCVKLFSVDKNNNEKELLLSDCRITREYPDSSHIMVIYSYEGCACSIIYTLEAE